MSTFPITTEGFTLLKNRLQKLKEEFETLPQIIAHARSKGDLKENADYHAAKERQGMLNAEINKINSDLQSSRVIDPQTLTPDTVTFGKKVHLKNIDNGETTHYTLFGPAETQLHAQELNPLSVTSTIAKSILGRKLNDKVTAITPSGDKNFIITEISLP